MAIILGMNSLIDLAESGIIFPTNFFTVKRSYLATNRVKIINFMKATIEGLYTLKKDRAFGLQLIKRYLRVADEMAGSGQARRRHLESAGPPWIGIGH